MGQTGLAVGKFLPPHKGHQFLLETAAREVDRLLVLVYSNPDPKKFPSSRRAQLLREIYGRRIGRADLRVVAISEASVPPDAATGEVHRRFVKVFLNRNSSLPYPDVVFSSEDYGEPFARTLGARHRAVDPDRRAMPISGTEIRRDPYANCGWLHPAVRRFYETEYVERAVFLGAESTGKTTTARAMAERYGTAWVPEYGAALYAEKGGRLAYGDFLAIAERHVELEDKAFAGAGAKHYLFADTNAVTTEFYSYFYHGRCDPRLGELARECRTRYPHAFLCEPDFPFVNDGTRDDMEGLHSFQHRMVRMQLDHHGIEHVPLAGPLEDRLRVAEEVLGRRKKEDYG